MTLRCIVCALLLHTTMALAAPTQAPSDSMVNEFIHLYEWANKYNSILKKTMNDYIKKIRQAIKEKYPKQNPEKQLTEIRRVLGNALAWKRIHPRVRQEVKQSFPKRMLDIAIHYKKNGKFRQKDDRVYMESNYRKPATRLANLFLQFLQTELKREAVHISEIMDGYKS